MTFVEKPKNEQMARIKTEKRIIKLEESFSQLRQEHRLTLNKKNGATGKEEIEELELELERLLTTMEKKETQIQICNARLKNYLYICTDFEIAPEVNTEMVDWFLGQMYPAGNEFTQCMVIYDEVQKDGMISTKYLKRRLPNLLSLGFNTYYTPASFCHKVNLKTRAIRNHLPPEYYLPQNPKEEDLMYCGSKKEGVKSTQAIVIDLDYREVEAYSGISAEDFYEILQSGPLLETGEPSFAIVSSEGRGLQLVFLLDKPFLTELLDSNIARYELLVKAMIRVFAAYGVDDKCATINHMFRVPNSFHTKAKSWGFILNWDRLKDDDYKVKRFQFEDLERQFCKKETHAKSALPASPETEQPAEPLPEVRKQMSSEARDRAASNLSKLARGRCKDILALIEMRRGIVTGCRNHILMVYASQFSIYSRKEDAIFKELKRVSKKFSTPNSDKDIEHLMKYAVKYYFTDQAIISKLRITTIELSKLIVIGHSTFDLNTYRRSKRRTPTGELISKTLKNERNARICALRVAGLTNKEIMSKMDVSLNTVKRAFRDKTSTENLVA